MLSTRKRSVLHLLACLLVMLLHGCSSILGTQEHALPNTQDLSANAKLEYWQFSGKIGLKQRGKAHSAYLNWTQCGDHFNLRLTGPLGQGAAHLFGDSSNSTLIRSDKTSVSANSPEELLALEIGWPIPVSQLLYWVRGIPEPKTPITQATQASEFTQSNWHITYTKHQMVEGYSLPAKAIAKKLSTRQPPLTITLLLKQWQLNPNCKATQ